MNKSLCNFIIRKDLTPELFPSFYIFIIFYFVYLFRAALCRLLLENSAFHCVMWIAQVFIAQNDIAHFNAQNVKFLFYPNGKHFKSNLVIIRSFVVSADVGAPSGKVIHYFKKKSKCKDILKGHSKHKRRSWQLSLSYRYIWGQSCKTFYARKLVLLDMFDEVGNFWDPQS